MHFYGGHFGGMHFILSIIWVLFLFWIFFIPYGAPCQKSKRETPLDILKKRYANGNITKEVFEEEKILGFTNKITLKNQNKN